MKNSGKSVGQEEDHGTRSDDKIRERFPITGTVAKLGRKGMERLLHDLQVYRVELEAQSEELRRSQLALEESRTEYMSLYDQAPVGYLSLTDEGVITQANHVVAQLLGTNRNALVDQPFARFLSRKEAEVFHIYLQDLLASPHRQVCEIQLSRLYGTSVYVRLDGTVIRNRERLSDQCRVVLTDITARKMAEKDLKIRDAAIMAAINGIGFAYPDGTIFYANTAFEKMWGFDEQQPALGFGLMDLWKDREALSEEYAKFQQDGRYSGVLTGRKRDGSVFDAQIEAITAVDDGGQPMCIMGSFADITEQRGMEEKLRESEETFRSLFENSRDGIFLTAPDGRVFRANPAACQMIGFTEEELRKRGRDAVVDADDPRLVEGLRERLRTGKFQGELDFKRKDGTRFPVELSSSLYCDPKGDTMACVLFRDITHRKRLEEDLLCAHAELEQRVNERTAELRKANERLRDEIAARRRTEQALRRSEAQLHAIIESAEDLILVKDRDRKIVLANPALERLFEMTEAEVKGRTVEEFFDREIATIMAERDLRILQGETVETELQMTVNNRVRIFHSISIPLRDEDMGITGICTIARDVTERKQALEKPQPRVDYPSRAMKVAMHQISYGAASDITVLLMGESGAGKDFWARQMHDSSPRSSGPFFALNCAALPSELADAELFGHEAGAFTGARGRRRGLLELAESGTLLLNEIGDLPLSLQSKLLMFLDSKEFMRLGGERKIRVNSRIIAATHKDLEEEVRNGKFLDALFYRLNVLVIRVPPLRERSEDIPLLAEQLLEQIADELQIGDVPELDSEAFRTLTDYRWPGNVRELRNVLERSLMLWDGGKFCLMLKPADKDTHSRQHIIDLSGERTLGEVADEVRRLMCVEGLRRSQGNKRRAAKLLGISHDAFHRYLKRYGIVSEKRSR